MWYVCNSVAYNLISLDFIFNKFCMQASHKNKVYCNYYGYNYFINFYLVSTLHLHISILKIQTIFVVTQLRLRPTPMNLLHVLYKWLPGLQESFNF